jgi:ubiquinone biosynthesis protein COQ4
MGYENLTPALERIKMVSGFLASQGQETKTVFALEDHYRDSPQMAEAVVRMKADPAVGRLISEGYTTPDYDLDELIKYPPGSLAHTYAKLMRLVGYSAKFFPEREIKSDADYCIMRVRKTHDLHHVVTGFSQQGPGEAGVIGVTAYQFGYPAFVLIDLAAMALTFHRAEGFQNAVNDVGRGMLMGHDCKPLLAVKWEEGWEKPVARWREELGIKPVTTGPQSWHALPTCRTGKRRDAGRRRQFRDGKISRRMGLPRLHQCARRAPPLDPARSRHSLSAVQREPRLS